MFLKTPFHAFLPKFTYLQKHGVNNMVDSDIQPSYSLSLHTTHFYQMSYRSVLMHCIRKLGGMEGLVEGSWDLAQVLNGKDIFRLFLNPLPYSTHKPTHILHTAENHAQNILDFAFPLTWASFGI